MNKNITWNASKSLVLVASIAALAVGCEGDTIYNIYGSPDARVENDSSTNQPDAEVDAGKTDPDAGEEGPVVIGMLDTMLDQDTGPLPRAFQLAINEAMAAGGLLGREIETEIVEEPRFEAGPNIRALVEAGAHVVIGPGNSENGFEAIDILGAAEIPFWSLYGGASSDFNNPWGISSFWVPSDIMTGPAAEVAKNRAGCSSAGFIQVGSPSETANAHVVQNTMDAATAAGLTYAGTLLTDFQPADLVDTLTEEWAADPPDCLIMDSPLVAIVLRDLPDELADTKLVLQDGLIPPILMGVLPSLEDLNGVYGVQPQFLHPERTMSYVDRYEEVFGEALTPQTWFDMANVYDATALFLLAIEKAGTTDGEAIRAALSDISSPDEGDLVVAPNEIAAGLAAIRNGQGVNYEGATGSTDYRDDYSWPADPQVDCYVITDADNFQVGECE